MRRFTLWIMVVLTGLCSITCNSKRFDTRDVDRMYKRGLALNRMGLYDEAIELLEKSLALEPERYDILKSYWRLRYKGDEGIREELKALERKNPDDPVYSRLLCALPGEPEERLTACRKARTRLPDEPEVYLSLGDVFRELQMVDSASTAYSKAVALDPSMIDASLSLAGLKAEEGDKEGAKALYRRIIERGGPEADGYDSAVWYLFFQHWDAGDLPDAVETVRALISGVRDPWVRHDIARELAGAKYELPLAEKMAREAIQGMRTEWMEEEYPEIDREWAESAARRYRSYFYDTLGFVLLQAGKREEAIGALEEAVDLIPFVDSDLMIRLSMLYKEVGRSEEATEALLQILSHSMNDKALLQLRTFYVEQYGDTTGIGALVTERRRKTVKPAPEFQLVDLSGEIVSLSDLRGKVVLLNFWFPT